MGRRHPVGVRLITSGFVHFEHAPPKIWDQFEELCADTFQDEFQDYALVRNGTPRAVGQGA